LDPPEIIQVFVSVVLFHIGMHLDSVDIEFFESKIDLLAESHSVAKNYELSACIGFLGQQVITLEVFKCIWNYDLLSQQTFRKRRQFVDSGFTVLFAIAFPTSLLQICIEILSVLLLL